MNVQEIAKKAGVSPYLVKWFICWMALKPIDDTTNLYPAATATIIKIITEEK